MAEHHPSRLVRKRRLRAFSGRGGVYAWLRAHHAQVVALRDEERRPWSDLLAAMAAHGVRDGRGKAPSLKNVSKAWGRVVRDVQVDAAALAPATARVGRVPPSRMSPSWLPQAVVAANSPPAAYPAPAYPVPAVVPSAAGTPAPAPAKPEYTEAQREHFAREMAKAKAGFAELDKKFLFPS